MVASQRKELNGEDEMKIDLRVQKAGAVLYRGQHDVSDAESFGTAFAEVWTRLREEQLARASSIGALYEELDERLLDVLEGAEISLTRP